MNSVDIIPYSDGVVNTLPVFYAGGKEHASTAAGGKNERLWERRRPFRPDAWRSCSCPELSHIPSGSVDGMGRISQDDTVAAVRQTISKR